MNTDFLWLLVIIVAIILEGATVSLTSIWFAIGAVVAWITSFFISSFLAQIFIFLAVSLVLLYFTRPVAVKYLKVGKERTNVNSLVGEIGVVILPIEPLKSYGQVKVNGQIWSAKSVDGIIIKKDTKVKIVGIEGVKLLVIPVEE